MGKEAENNNTSIGVPPNTNMFEKLGTASDVHDETAASSFQNKEPFDSQMA